MPRVGSSLTPEAPALHITDEAAITPAHGEELRVEALVSDGESVAQGQPLLRLRAMPDMYLTAPMAGRVAKIELRPGHRLSQMVLFHEAGGDRYAYDVSLAGADADELRRVLQMSGLWRQFRSRPFGRVPKPGAIPAAIFVIATDSRPDAPDPAPQLTHREAEFSRGLDALARLSEARIFLCQAEASSYTGALPAGVSRVITGKVHPNGLSGLMIHRHMPARVEAPVWDIHAEDVADIGSFLETGYVPATRVVSISGSGDALREAKLVQCQPGADLRGLSQPLLRPGPHVVVSGSFLDGRPAHWLSLRDRQVTVLTRDTATNNRHWFNEALDHVSRRAPIIPTAALDLAFGGVLPAAALVRVLASGDVEGFTRLGGLSLLEEDLALADYATGARPRLMTQVRAILDRIEEEEGVA
ncbi:biotin/lipoyl-containing protein [Celeribacter persicus]|uniref:Na+-transporting NADH:ubiquinone oxidoreductase subunit A n=1 Tax=Celeribacter persicus TaxID=1651082 RepID=A0A2T5H0E9_9RHOB|nr:biotin/lipoyl-containing protein [Celeribacter persicus]PTQ65063.1 Na+-transporting NADH:ubiquinone oxidoreductase subunit A [Celeribacter persicus]